jgi:Fe2+ or Zn2+ uptake regulation protein
MNNLTLLLQALEISEKEYVLYKELYNLGPSTVAHLSKITQIPRTTIYQNLDKLHSKGLISQTVKGSKKLFVAEAPSKVTTLINSKRLELNDQERNISEAEKLIPDFLNQFEVKKSPFGIIPPQTEIRYYEGSKAVQKVYDNMLTFPEVKSYVNFFDINTYFPENNEKFINAINNGTIVWDINVGDQQNDYFIDATKGYKNYHLKYFPKSKTIKSMDYAIYGNNIAYIQGGLNPTAITITNKLQADNARVIYDILWESLPEVNE